MNTDNTQVGLKKLCEAFIDGDISAGQFKRAVRIWHNRQVEAKLAHISEYAENVISIDENGEFSMKAIPLSLVAAERNKLKKEV